MPVTLITVIGNQVLLLLITATVSSCFVVISRQLLLYISCTSLSLQKLTCSTNYEYTIGDYPQALNGAIASLRPLMVPLLHSGTTAQGLWVINFVDP